MFVAITFSNNHCLTGEKWTRKICSLICFNGEFKLAFDSMTVVSVSSENAVLLDFF